MKLSSGKILFILVFIFVDFGLVDMERLNFYDVLSHPFWILRTSGFWFDKSATKLYKFYGICVHFFLIDLFTACQLFYAFNARNLNDLTDTLTTSCSYFVGLIKTARFILQVNQIMDLIDELNKIIEHMQAVEETEMPRLRARVEQAKTMFQLFWGSCVAAATVGTLLPLSAYLSNPYPPYYIPYKSWSPFNHENNFYSFLGVSIFESLDGLVFVQMVAAADILPVFFFNTAAGLIEELGDRLSSIRENVSESSGDENLKLLENYIEIHIEIKAYLRRSQTIFSPMIFTQVSISLVILCTIAYTLSTVSDWSKDENLNIYLFYYSFHQQKTL